MGTTVVLVSIDNLFLKNDPYALMLDRLLNSDVITLSEKELKQLKDILENGVESNVDRIRMRSLFTRSVKDKLVIDVSRALEDVSVADLFDKSSEEILRNLPAGADTLKVFISSGLDFFLENIFVELGADTFLANSMLIADKRLTGELNFVIDDEFMETFIRNLRNDNSKVVGIGDKKQDSFMLSLVDDAYDQESLDKFI